MIFNKQYLRTASAVLKIAEMVCLSVTLALFRGVPLTFGDPQESSVAIGTDADFFAGGIMVAAMLMTPFIFLMSIMSSLHLKYTPLEIGVNALFASFLMISASLGMDFWHDPSNPWKGKKSEGLAMVIFCYISAAFYCADLLVACKNYCCKPKTPVQSNASTSPA
ncbi:uncharacterized protein [Panulirus ornatus]|uniref:uncharacterized protein n=1 Tax=Panulirus ornatus TaxID=150431 RepID=UPI003A8AFC23